MTYTISKDLVQTTYTALIHIAKLRQDDNIIDGKRSDVPQTLSSLDADAYLSTPFQLKKNRIEITQDTKSILVKDPEMLGRIYQTLCALDVNNDGVIDNNENQNDVDILEQNATIIQFSTTIQALGTSELQVQITQAIDKIKPSVVEIKKFYSLSADANVGSGTIIQKTPQKNGQFTYQVLTNNHVVDAMEREEDTFFVTTSDNKHTFMATLVGSGDVLADVAILEFTTPLDFPVVNIAKDPVHDGDTIIPIGNPSGNGIDYRPTVVTDAEDGQSGFESPYSNYLYDFGTIEIYTTAEPGNSGSGGFNLNGELTGLLFSYDTEHKSVWHVIPAQVVQASINNIIAHRNDKVVVYGDWGLIVRPMDQQEREESLPPNANSSGIHVDQVYPGSAAARSGLKAGDIITAVNGDTDPVTIEDWNSLYKFQSLMRYSQQDEKYILTVYDSQDATKPLRTLPLAAEVKPFKNAEAVATVYGFTASELLPQIRHTTNIPNEIQGVRVNYTTDSPPYPGLYKGGIITNVNGIPTPDIASFRAALQKVEKIPQQTLKLRVYVTGELYYSSSGGIGAIHDVVIKR